MLKDTALLGCPKCKYHNIVIFWDRITKKKRDISDDAQYISAGADIEDIQDQDSYYICPVCGHGVNGIDFLRDKVQDA